MRKRLHLITVLLIAPAAFGSTISIQNKQLSASFDSGKLTISSFATGKHIASIPCPEAKAKRLSFDKGDCIELTTAASSTKVTFYKNSPFAHIIRTQEFSDETPIHSLKTDIEIPRFSKTINVSAQRLVRCSHWL